jgi:hypothetical protein
MFVLGSLVLHWVEYQYLRTFTLRSMPIFLFGCLDIWYLQLISYLNVKSCLDGQSDVLHLDESMLIIYVFENNFLCNF